ncbi:MAG: hypothetical protein MK103_08695, partial [Planctomycetes bacterium]|nr:hypothetical protein [Planctomycetota bacterium]
LRQSIIPGWFLPLQIHMAFRDSICVIAALDRAGYKAFPEMRTDPDGVDATRWFFPGWLSA